MQDIGSQLNSCEIPRREISFHPSYALVLQLFHNTKEFSTSFEDEMRLSMMRKSQSKLLGSHSQRVS